MRPNGSRRPAAAALSMLGVCVLAGLAMTGCYHHGQTATAGGAIRAGIAPDFPPLAFTEDGKVTGLEAEFANKLTERGMNVTLVQMPWEQLIPALQDGKIDVIMSGMSITEQRVTLVDFSVPYLRVGQMALVRAKDYDRLRGKTAMDQPKSRVGVVSGTTGEKYARAHLKQATIVPVETVQAGVAALRGKQIDFFLNDAPIIWGLTTRAAHNDDLAGLYRALTQEYIAWAVRRGEGGDELRQKLNEALLEWQAHGELEALVDQWITVRKVTLETAK